MSKWKPQEKEQGMASIQKLEMDLLRKNWWPENSVFVVAVIGKADGSTLPRRCLSS